MLEAYIDIFGISRLVAAASIFNFANGAVYIFSRHLCSWSGSSLQEGLPALPATTGYFPFGRPQPSPSYLDDAVTGTAVVHCAGHYLTDYGMLGIAVVVAAGQCDLAGTALDAVVD